LMPGTALLLKVDPYNPEQNIEGGVRYFSFLLNSFKDLDLALCMNSTRVIPVYENNYLINILI